MWRREGGTLFGGEFSTHTTIKQFHVLVHFTFNYVVGSSDLQKIKKNVDNLYAEKQKLEKEQKNKKGSKGKTKVNLRIESDDVSSHKTTHAAFDTERNFSIAFIYAFTYCRQI